MLATHISLGEKAGRPGYEADNPMNQKQAPHTSQSRFQASAIPAGALTGIRVLDLSRVLAGPFSAQTLADLGADVIKIERPKGGDDSRAWGPPFMPDSNGNASGESTYFHSVNRGKRSVTVDIAHPDGQALIRKLALQCDVLIENYKVGTLDRYGLGYEDLHTLHPGLVYCSITGFGQTGPYRARPGYDTIVQAMGGLMSITGEPDREPQRIGVAVIDVMTGLYATIAVLGALMNRHRTGVGQRIDLALLDVQFAGLANMGMNYLATGEVPKRTGNINLTVQPSGVFSCSDGQLMMIVGNNGQFQSLCKVLSLDQLARDARFASNALRVNNFQALHAVINAAFTQRPLAEWLAALETAKIPAGPINDIAQAFADPHVQERGAVIELEHETLGRIPTIANPIRYSDTNVRYQRPSPLLSQHTQEVLGELLGLNAETVKDLARRGIV